MFEELVLVVMLAPVVVVMFLALKVIQVTAQSNIIPLVAIQLVDAKSLVLKLAHLQIFLTIIVMVAPLVVAHPVWIIELVMCARPMVILKKPMRQMKLTLYHQHLIFLKKLD